MKSQAIKGTSTNQNIGRQSHDAGKFSKVLDGRKQPIRGLWIRGERYYAQLTVEDPITGAKAVRRVPLKDKDDQPVTTAAQAVEAMARLKVKRADNDLPTLKRCPKFSDYAAIHLEFIGAGEGAKKSATVTKDTTALKRWSDHMGQMRLDQIKPAHISKFIAKRQKEGAKNRIVNLDVISLRSCLKQARTDGWIQKLPTDGIKPLPVVTPKRPFFGVTELNALCEAAMGKKRNEAGKRVPLTKNAVEFVDYLKLLAYSGARRNEALAIQWQDIDWNAKLLNICHDTKNRKFRSVDFNPKLEAHLLDMKTRRAPDCDFLFPSPQRGERNASVKTFKESLGLVRTAAKLPRFTFHDCRHHFISLCVMSGIDFMTIAKWVGHQDGGVLIGKVYGHLANEHRQAMAAKLTFEPVVLPKVSNG